ncbi:MAG TPA: sulfatase [Candidatus Hydrogenedentes bacterium]|nr:sulfatase [Candidatus Hydrogenedentota bacterium]
MWLNSRRACMRLVQGIGFCWLLLAGAPLAGCREPVAPGAKPPEQTVAPQPITVDSASRPNVILIVADALRADRVFGKRGDIALMPNLSQFAQESWNYAHATSQASWTKPSVASYLTALYPGVHRTLFGVHVQLLPNDPVEADALPREFETMPKYLKSQGYATACLQTNANVSGAFGFAEGFDAYFFKGYPECRANQVTDKAIETMDAMKRPFFYYIHYMDTHLPYDPPAQRLDSFGPLPALEPSDENILNDYESAYMDWVLNAIGKKHAREFGELSEGGKERIRMKYDAEVQFLDAELGRLLAHIRLQHPNTIVIVTADHGEELWEHGGMGHGRTVYEELVHVPLIIAQPGASARVVEAPVELIDLLPSLAGILGTPPRDGWQGIDILSHPDALPMDRPTFSMTMSSMRRSTINLQSVTIRPYKLVRDLHAQTFRVYDLQRDPGELSPLTSPDAALLARLETASQKLRERNAAHPSIQTPAAAQTVDPETIRQLEALGYKPRQ